VSGGHLCEAEAPTEPAGETQRDRGNPFPTPPSLRAPQGARQSVFSPLGYYGFFHAPIARVRVSGGHLCEAEAPTEPAGETQCDRGNPFPLWGITDSFVLRTQNDRPFSH